MAAERGRTAQCRVVETDVHPPNFDSDARAIIDVRPLTCAEDGDVSTTDGTVVVPSSFTSDDDGSGDIDNWNDSRKKNGVGGMGSYPCCQDTFPRCTNSNSSGSSNSSFIFLSETSGRSGLFFESIKEGALRAARSQSHCRDPDHRRALPSGGSGCQLILPLAQEDGDREALAISTPTNFPAQTKTAEVSNSFRKGDREDRIISAREEELAVSSGEDNPLDPPTPTAVVVSPARIYPHGRFKCRQCAGRYKTAEKLSQHLQTCKHHSYHTLGLSFKPIAQIRSILTSFSRHETRVSKLQCYIHCAHKR